MEEIRRVDRSPESLGGGKGSGIINGLGGRGYWSVKPGAVIGRFRSDDLVLCSRREFIFMRGLYWLLFEGHAAGVFHKAGWLVMPGCCLGAWTEFTGATYNPNPQKSCQSKSYVTHTGWGQMTEVNPIA